MFNSTPPVDHNDRSFLGLRSPYPDEAGGLPQKRGAEGLISLPGDISGDGLVVIGKGTKVVGEISDCTQIEIDGNLEGSVVANVVIVRVGGRLKGIIQSKRAEVHGMIEGQVLVEEHLDIRSTGHVSGELTYGRLSVADGGKLAGNIQTHSRLEQQSVPPEAKVYVSGQNGL
jgi:cytoskeletal protein CcmA (bactofilin family)